MGGWVRCGVVRLAYFLSHATIYNLTATVIFTLTTVTVVNRREVANVVTSTLTGLIDNNFTENEEEMSGSDASESDMSNRIIVNLDGLNMDGIEVGELCDSDDSGRLDSAHESNSDDQNWPEFNLENDACKDGYRAGCRRIVALDRCFLKGYYGG
ncbi:hypothetical protein J1N35_014931 [Gossypium stocksii]|uniref:Uncharacterized protein n=1 Tax=Gossypium stocksii TaxID=47602 RepID=A0A9D3VVY6_9ROSI|nr:hypothetical protein J1N35_014931 [Gossypium stocksii]